MILLKLESHPVVPLTTGIELFNPISIFLNALFGVQKLIAISEPFIDLRLEFLSAMKDIVCPLSIEIFSISFPIFPYPSSAIFIYLKIQI